MFQQHLNTSRRPDASTEAGEVQPGGAAALLSSVRGGKGRAHQPSPAEHPANAWDSQQNSLPSPTCARPPQPGRNSRDFVENSSGRGPAWLPGGPDSPHRLLYGTSGAADPQDGTTLADVPTVKNRAQGTLTRARTAPARDGLQEDEIWKVMLYSSLDYFNSRARRRTHQSEEFMASVCMCLSVCVRACVVLECQNPQSTNKLKTFFKG